MRSENAVKFIKSNTLDLHDNNRMDTTGYVSIVVSASKAYGAIEIAEQEMLDKAVKAHIRSCTRLCGDNRCYNRLNDSYEMKCDTNCDYVKRFKEYMK